MNEYDGRGVQSTELRHGSCLLSSVFNEPSNLRECIRAAPVTCKLQCFQSLFSDLRATKVEFAT